MAQSCNWIQQSAELEKAGKPFAIATVIDTVAPTSAKPMSKAIITPDGRMDGWIGGGCAQDIIIDEAVKSITGWNGYRPTPLIKLNKLNN